MPSFLARLFATSAPARPEQTKTIAPALFALHALAQPRWTLRNGAELIREGYERNAVVYRCVRMIAENAACVPWLVYAGETEAPNHPLARLIAQPNAQEAWPAFLEGVFSDLMLFGDSYVQATLIDGAPRALYRLRPDRMSVVAAVNGWPRAYEYRVGGEVTRYSMEQGGQAPILHLRCFHPLDDHYGLAPLAAAQTPLDVHNAADAWCKALLDNSARPSGALVYAGSAGALTEEQFTRLKSELDENFSGARNAGRPLLLEGGLDWKPLSLSPKDMDFMEAKAAAARDIALALGVPPLLLGLPGDNTHANFQEANRAFWRQTIIPLVRRTQKSFETWLTASFPQARLEADLDGLDALASERESEWRRVGAASFLSDDEKRAALGYGALARKHAPDQSGDE